MPDSLQRAAVPTLLLALAMLIFGLLLFKHASYPLLWQGEAATAMFGVRVLEYGFPKVHGELAAVYPANVAVENGVSPELDAFRAGLWGPYYFAALVELVAGAADDPWTRTGLLRTGFGLLGCLGIALLLSGWLPALGGRGARRLGAAAFLLLAAGSVSFLLHLREVGPLGPTLLLLGALLRLVLGLQRARAAGEPAPGLRSHLLAVAPLLFLLGATSTVSALAVLLALLLLGLGRALRRAPGALSLDLVPLLVGVLLLMPLLRFLGPAGLRWDLLGASWEVEAAWGASLGNYLLHLLRYEWLAPALVGRLVMLALRRLPGEPVPLQSERLAAADFLSLLVTMQLLVLAGLPVFLEEHTVALAPLLISILVLDGASLLAWLGAREGGARRAGGACAAGLGAAVLMVAALHAPEIGGRIHEITNRYRGPLDMVVAYLQEGYEDPSDLVIATNYESAAFRYLLDAIVTIGAYPTRLPQDYILQPDIILPRPSGRSQRELGQMALRASYDQEDLPVVNLLANNVPQLSERDVSGLVHRFESAELPEGGAGTPVLERVDPDAEEPPGEAAEDPSEPPG